MPRTYTREERNTLATALRAGEPLICPACGNPLDRREVSPRPELPYVRRRVWLLCPVCGRSAAIDLAPRTPS